MITAGLVKFELERLQNVLNNKIERTKDNLSSQTVLKMNLIDTGFIKLSDSTYALDIKNRGKSYISFIITFRGKGVDIYEDHIVIEDKKEVPLSSIDKPFKLVSVRYNRVMEEIYKRVLSLSEELSKD